MKIKRSPFVFVFLVGFAACQISGGSSTVLLLLLTCVAAVTVACACFGLTLKLPPMRLSRFMADTETKPIPRETFVLGIGHRVSR